MESYLHTWLLESPAVSFEVIQCFYGLVDLLCTLSISPLQAERILMLPLEHESLKTRPEADIDVCCLMSYCYRILGKLSEAQTLVEEKIKTYNTLFEAGHERTFSLRNELANILCQSKKTDDAIQLYKEILQYCEPQHWRRPHILATLGGLYSSSRDAKKGILLLEEAVHIQESIQGPEHL